MTTTTTTPVIVGMMSNGLLIVTSGHGLYLVHPQWLVTSRSVTR
jgi:hypothetical protein